MARTKKISLDDAKAEARATLPLETDYFALRSCPPARLVQGGGALPELRGALISVARPTWTIVWGWTASGQSVWREQFVDKRLCWERTKVLMGVLEAGVAEKRTPILQVWSGSDVTTFRMYDQGSRFCQWGLWGAYTMKTAERAGG